MNLTASAQLEYAILETLVRNGQKNSMDLALSTSEFLENFCNGDSFKCAKKWKSALNINEDGKNDQSQILIDFFLLTNEVPKIHKEPIARFISSSKVSNA